MYFCICDSVRHSYSMYWLKSVAAGNAQEVRNFLVLYFLSTRFTTISRTGIYCVVQSDVT